MKWQEKLTPEQLNHVKNWTLPKGVRLTRENVLLWVKESKNCRVCECVKNTLESC